MFHLLVIMLLASACSCDAAEKISDTQITFRTEAALMGPVSAVKTVMEEEPVVFGEEITFACEYVSSEDIMPYALFTPSTAEETDAVPLIVWLHGRGECGATENWFMHTGLPQVLSEWELDGFNAYVICPQLSGQWNMGYWDNSRTAADLKNLLDRFVAEHNVDTERIILCGFSAGGVGAMYMAIQMPDYFSKLVVMSSLQLYGRDVSQISIPTVGFSENAVSVGSFMKSEFPAVFGENSVRYYDVKHNAVPNAAFNDDTDGNHRSDLVEWMLTDSYQYACGEARALC